MKEIEYVTYGRDLRGGHASFGPGGTLSAAFGADGMSSLLLTTNLDDAHEEIGVFRGKLPASTVTRLVELLHESRYQEVASGGPLRPDAASTSMGAAFKGDPGPKVRVFPLTEIPPEVLPYQAAAREAAQQLLAQPERVVRGTVQAARSHFSAAEPLALTVSLQNIGRESLALDSPTRGADSIRFRLERDKPAQSLDWERDVWETEIGPDAVSGLTAPQLKAGTKRVVLAPKESLTFLVRAKIAAAVGEGTCRAVVTYFSGSSPGGKVAAVEGALSMRSGPFAIAGR